MMDRRKQRYYKRYTKDEKGVYIELRKSISLIYISLNKEVNIHIKKCNIFVHNSPYQSSITRPINKIKGCRV